VERVVTQLVIDEVHYSVKLVSVGSVCLKPRHGEFAFRMKFGFTDCCDVYVVSSSSSAFFLSETELAFHASIRKLRVMGRKKDN